jgi:hypothetical protein
MNICEFLMEAERSFDHGSWNKIGFNPAPHNAGGHDSGAYFRWE